MMRENSPLCVEASTYYYDTLSGHHSDIPAAIQAHIAGCSVCQSEIRRLDDCLQTQGDSKPTRLDVQYLAVHHRLLNQWVCCDKVKPFLPLLSVSGQALEMLTPVTAHLEHCDVCRHQRDRLADLRLSAEQTEQAVLYLAGQPLEAALPQEIQDVLEAIRDSENSGIATRVALDSDGQIQVEVQQQPVLRKPQYASQQGGRSSVRLWIRAGLAASILMAISICFLSIPSAQGIALRQVYQAVEQLVNCRIQIFVPEQTKPYQTILFSRELQIQMYQNPDKATLWDLDHKTMLNSGSGVQEPVKQTSLPALQAGQRGFGLMPFNSLQELPASYSWVRVEGLDDIRPGQQVYDLQWGQADRSTGQVVRRWRGFLNASTLLPERIEWWEQLPGQQQPQLIMRMEIDYPDTAVLADEIHKVFPEYKTPE